MKANATRKPFNVCQEVTKRIVFSLVNGEIPWRKPWNAPGKEDIINFKSRQPYKGINRLLLGKPGEWMTYKQCKDAGGHIKQGEKGHLIVRFDTFIPKELKEEAKKLENEGKSIEHLKRVYMKHDWVFHIDQCEGIESKTEHHEMNKAQSPTTMADLVINDYEYKENFHIIQDKVDSITIEQDSITLPNKEQFTNEEGFYNAVFTGMIASTANPSRCNRKITTENGRLSIKEELIREIGASMTLNGVGLEHKDESENTSAKCQEWIKAFNEDYNLIISVSSAAEKAARYLLKPIYG